MSNDRDQEIVKSAIADTGSGLLEFLTSLGQREAIAFGDGVTLPVRIKFDELPKHCMPRSSTALFTEQWQKSVGDEGFLEGIVDRWRNASSATAADAAMQMAMFAEAMNLSGPAADVPAAQGAIEERRAHPREPVMPTGEPRRDVPSIRRETQPVPQPASPTQPGNALRAIRDRLQQR